MSFFDLYLQIYTLILFCLVHYIQGQIGEINDTLNFIPIGTRYVVAVGDDPPFVQRYLNTKTNKYEYRGYCIDLLDQLKEIFGFNYEIKEPPAARHGNQDPITGEWDGLIEKLLTGQADIALAPIKITPARKKFVDFTIPIFEGIGYSMLMRRINYSDRGLTFLLDVMDPWVWIILLIGLGVSIVLLWLYSSCSMKKKGIKVYPDRDCHDRLQIPSPYFGLATWTLGLFWALCSTAVLATYCGRLGATATLNAQNSFETAINSFTALFSQHQIRYTVVKGSDAELYFKTKAISEDRAFNILQNLTIPEEFRPLLEDAMKRNNIYSNGWRYMQEVGLLSDFEKGLQKVAASSSLTQEFALIDDATKISYAEISDCRLQQVGEIIGQQLVAIAVQQGSLLREQLSAGIQKLLNQRELERLKEKWFNENPNAKKCENRDEFHSSRVHLMNVAFIYFILGGGIVFSFLFFIFELFCC